MNPEQVTRQEFLFLSGPEKILFYLLAFASLAYGVWQIWQRSSLWRTGRPISWAAHSGGNFIPSGSDLKQWLANIRIYVLAQRKVRSSRPKSGAPMHLMIFYGFLSLLIGTTLLAINTYSPFKFHFGVYYVVYEQALDWMGLAFLVGVGWAFFRRAKMSREELGAADLKSADPAQQEKQWLQGRRRPLTSDLSDQATLALLFVIGFTGFLLEGARIAAHPEPFDASTSPVGMAFSYLLPGLAPFGYRFIWWFHMVWIFGLFAVFPRMRLRHIVMAVASTAGKPPYPMGELQPISMEEVEETGQIGVSLAKDYSRWHLMSLDACMECGRCTEVCPAWNVGKVLNPKQVVQDIRGTMESGSPVPAAISDEALWACTTCNACVEACPVLIRHVDLIVDARRNLVSEGKLSGTAAVMLRQTGSTGNAWGAPASNREDWMQGLDVPLARNGAEFEYLFWVGCAGATDPSAAKTTKAVSELLNKAGVSYACLGQEETCTGDAARRVGEEFLFQEKAQQNIATFQKYKVKKIVTPCPHCLNTLKNEYQRFGAELEVVHHTQLLSDLVSQGRLKAASPAKGEVAYHDPCYLARVNGEADAPRALLGIQSFMNGDPLPTPSEGLVEPEHFGQKTLCCGAGGGRMWMDEAPDERPALRRVKELLDTGAKQIAVGCPFCRIMLDASVKQASQDEIKLVDLAEMLKSANESTSGL